MRGEPQNCIHGLFTKCWCGLWARPSDDVSKLWETEAGWFSIQTATFTRANSKTLGAIPLIFTVQITNGNDVIDF